MPQLKWYPKDLIYINCGFLIFKMKKPLFSQRLLTDMGGCITGGSEENMSHIFTNGGSDGVTKLIVGADTAVATSRFFLTGD